MTSETLKLVLFVLYMAIGFYEISQTSRTRDSLLLGILLLVGIIMAGIRP